MYNTSMDLQPRQISKVVYEAIRAYDVTIGQSERPSWEATTQDQRDLVLNQVDALLRGVPHGPVSIRPSDQVKWRMLAAIVGAFVLVYNPPPPPVVVMAPPPPPVVPIPVEKFADPDAVSGNTISDGRISDETMAKVNEIFEAQKDSGDPATVDEALAQADANIAKADEPAVETGGGAD